MLQVMTYLQNIILGGLKSRRCVGHREEKYQDTEFSGIGEKNKTKQNNNMVRLLRTVTRVVLRAHESKITMFKKKR